MPLSALTPVNGKHKREDIKAAVRRLALAAGPGGRLPTVRVCCAQLGVAKVTLDAALDDLEAAGLIQRRQGSGIYVTPRIVQKSIGLVFGHNIFEASASPFYALLMRRCRERAKSHGESFSFFIDPLPDEVSAGAPPVHPDLADAIASEKLHGILLTARNSEAEEAWLRAQGLPVVSLGFAEDGPPPIVTIDHRELIRRGVAVLAAQGCRRIGLVAPHDHDSRVGAGMIGTFREALRQRRLRVHENLIWSHDHALGLGRESRDERGACAFQAVFGGCGRAPDGLVVADDMLTRGLLNAARAAGIEAGRDVRIASHANRGSPVLEEWAERLTRLEVDPDEIVEAMFGLLEGLMSGAGARRQTVTVKPTVRVD